MTDELMTDELTHERMTDELMTDKRMKSTLDMPAANKPIDPSKADVKKTHTLQFVKDLKVMP